MRTLDSISCVVLVLSALSTQVRAAETLDFPLDPVALVGGNEASGLDEFSVERGRFRYKFVDAKNKAAFEKEPERFEVQLGGSCARMGPLNNGGQPDLFAVHDGRIYLFASDDCRATFIQDPDALLESDDALPEVTDESKRRGRELLDLAVQAAGGADVIDAIKTYDDKMYRVVNEPESYNGHVIVFPDSLHHKAKRNDMWWAMTVAGNTGWFASRDDSEHEPVLMAESQRHAVEREFYRLPIVILRSRSLPNFVCSYAGPGEFNGLQAEKVAVAMHGATTTLLIDPKSGEIFATEFRGRGPDAALGHVQVRYSDIQTINGVTLPLTSWVNFEGVDIAEMSGTLDEVNINGEVDPATFKRPG